MQPSILHQYWAWVCLQIAQPWLWAHHQAYSLSVNERNLTSLMQAQQLHWVLQGQEDPENCIQTTIATFYVVEQNLLRSVTCSIIQFLSLMLQLCHSLPSCCYFVPSLHSTKWTTDAKVTWLSMIVPMMIMVDANTPCFCSFGSTRYWFQSTSKVWVISDMLWIKMLGATGGDRKMTMFWLGPKKWIWGSMTNFSDPFSIEKHCLQLWALRIPRSVFWFQMKKNAFSQGWYITRG